MMLGLGSDISIILLSKQTKQFLEKLHFTVQYRERLVVKVKVLDNFVKVK